jgi:hypothetical protein
MRLAVAVWALYAALCLLLVADDVCCPRHRGGRRPPG